MELHKCKVRFSNASLLPVSMEPNFQYSGDKFNYLIYASAFHSGVEADLPACDLPPSGLLSGSLLLEAPTLWVQREPHTFHSQPGRWHSSSPSLSRTQVLSVTSQSSIFLSILGIIRISKHLREQGCSTLAIHQSCLGNSVKKKKNTETNNWIQVLSQIPSSPKFSSWFNAYSRPEATDSIWLKKKVNLQAKGQTRTW